MSNAAAWKWGVGVVEEGGTVESALQGRTASCLINKRLSKGCMSLSRRHLIYKNMNFLKGWD